MSVGAKKHSRTRKPVAARFSNDFRDNNRLSHDRAKSRKSHPQVKRLPTRSDTLPLRRSRRIPPVFRVLLLLQKSSNLLAFMLIAGTLGVYAWAFCTQQLWSKKYKELEKLQRNERQITGANETLKNQSAEQAEKPETGLVPMTTKNTVFLPKDFETETKKKKIATRESNLSRSSIPVGY